MISVVVPVYRSQAMLDALYSQVSSVLDTQSLPWEIVFVEDAGGDASWSLIEALATADPRVRGLRMSRNYGQHNALLCGIRAARGDVVVTIDDDLQHPPREIIKLLERLTPDVDVVYGYSVSDQPHGVLRGTASRLSKWALRVAMGVESARHASAFRAFRTHLRRAFGENYGPSVNIDVMLTWGTTRFASVQVKHDERMSGTSGYTLRKLVAHLLNMITGFTALPLQFASVLGIVFSVVGFLLLIYVCIVRIIYGVAVPGFTFLACAITVLAGVELFALGMIGEYVARIHFRTMGRPTFVVAEETRTAHPEADAEGDTHYVNARKDA
ncbi:glycosyltransferase family 2 protein [Burkholderia sp. S171]|uniref:glycosyltransferase family 2 protein n=1 Tax=Burkholderia sp. S171 TaxID=1641860 RepID=UPI00131DB19D|nr:glycosyltransferase family 2 protein [Burkholderia sp. S171]